MTSAPVPPTPQARAAAVRTAEHFRELVHPLSVAAYEALTQTGLMPENVELINGTVVEKMAKSPLHTFILVRLQELLRSLLPATHTLRAEQPLRLSHSMPEPDVSVVQGSARDFVVSHPDTAALVIEVSVSTEDRDREKLAGYAAAGVTECWIVFPESKKVEVHRDHDGARYATVQTLTGNAVVACQSIPTLRINLADLWPDAAA